MHFPSLFWLQWPAPTLKEPRGSNGSVMPRQRVGQGFYQNSDTSLNNFRLVSPSFRLIVSIPKQRQLIHAHEVNIEGTRT